MSARRFNKPERGEHREKVAQIARQISFEFSNANFEYANGEKDRVLSRMMENADKWVDPTLTVEENRKAAKKRYGLKTKGEALQEVKDAKEQNRDRARRTIERNIEAIEEGRAHQLVQDIADHYGREWVNDQIRAARETVSQPEPEPEPEPDPTPEPTPTPEPARPIRYATSPVLQAADRLPRPVRSLVINLYVLARYSPDYGGERVCATG